ncbi:magnesium transporter CorA family protein [Curtobacterium sp. RRHDQ10]|uniref:magnesium transporter CorA family protein n=1 Tax=Curtobacterium phyllosphaerae TaxID=3413379 RepID=UPI003BF1192E
MTRTRAWRDGSVEAEGFPVADTSDHLEHDDGMVWIDFTDPSADDLAQVEEELGVHELASEDALEPGQRTKLDRYRGGLFLVVHDITRPRSVDPDDATLVSREVKAFITPRALVTMHGADFDMDEIVRRWDANADLATHGVPFLVWGLLDGVVDHATTAVEQMDEMVDRLESDLFDTDARTAGIQRRSFGLRKSLGTIRRLVVPMHDVIQSILHGDADRLTDGIRPYFRDVADHVASVADETDSLRDTVASVLDTNLNLASNRQNLVMKKVTSWAAIIAIPTAITGFFGQNVTFPGESSWSGLVISLVLIIGTSVTLYGVFKRKDWL